MSLNVINQKLSIYIPFVFPNITEARICDTFRKLGLGDADRVDFVEKNDTGNKHKMAFIHFNQWYMNDVVAGIHDTLMNGKGSTRIVYDDPWFWNIFVNKKPRTVEEIALERELAIAKEINHSERIRADYFQSVAMTWNAVHPIDCARIHNMIPYIAYQPVDIDPIEGYGVPYVMGANPNYYNMQATQSNEVPQKTPCDTQEPNREEGEV